MFGDAKNFVWILFQIYIMISKYFPFSLWIFRKDKVKYIRCSVKKNDNMMSIAS